MSASRFCRLLLALGRLIAFQPTERSVQYGPVQERWLQLASFRGGGQKILLCVFVSLAFQR